MIMKYSILADTYERLEKESGKLKKTEILSQLLQKTSTELLPKIVLLASGKIYPSQSMEKTGIADKMIIKILLTMVKHPEIDSDKIVMIMKTEGLRISKNSIRWVIQKYEIKKKESPSKS